MPTPQDRPTLHTVAERAGVSKSLVSLVARGSPKVSPERREAVERAMAELGYRPNTAARTLREGRTRTVGVLVNDARHPWYADLLDGLGAVLRPHGLHVLISGGRLGERADDTVLPTFRDIGMDAVVLAGTQPTPPAIADLADRVPMIAVGTRDIDVPRVDTIAGDDHLGGLLATRHLIELGHRRIAHISGHLPATRNLVGELRRQGYEQAMHEHGLGDHIQVELGDYTEDSGYRSAVRLLHSDDPPTAIFAIDDLTCLGAQSAAAELRITMPGQLSLVGYNNSPLAQLRSVGLTSVDGASYDVGRRAGEVLLARIDRPDRSAEVHLLPPALAVRRSTARVPRPGTRASSGLP